MGPAPDVPGAGDRVLAIAEALADERVTGPGRALPVLELAEAAGALEWPALADALVGDGWAARRGEDLAAAPGARARLDAARRERVIAWASGEVAQGELLDAFANHCRDELDEVEVLEAGPARLALAWRRERATVELRLGALHLERLAGAVPALLIGPPAPALAERLAADPALRERIAVYDLELLEKINAVRSSVFVYFEWFLRDLYGVKVLPAPAFTQGLVDRGVISLGFG